VRTVAPGLKVAGILVLLVYVCGILASAVVAALSRALGVSVSGEPWVLLVSAAIGGCGTGLALGLLWPRRSIAYAFAAPTCLLLIVGFYARGWRHLGDPLLAESVLFSVAGALLAWWLVRLCRPGSAGQTKGSRLRRVFLVLGTLAGFFVLLAAAAFGPFVYDMHHNPFNAEQFDQSQWMHAARDGAGESPRGPMAEDLRRRLLRKGMSKDEVRRLLGKSDNSEADEAAGHQDTYYLGHWSSLSIDGDALLIHYDKRGKIVATEIFTH